MIDVKKLLTKIISKLHEHENFKTICITVTGLTIPAKDTDGPGELDVDFSNYFDTSEYNLWNVECILNNTKLPYMSPAGAYTIISAVGSDSCTISNNAGVWSNYAGYFTLTLRRRGV